MSRKSCLSRQVVFLEVQFAWNPMVARLFHKLENGLSRQVVFAKGVVPDRFYYTPEYVISSSNTIMSVKFYQIKTKFVQH